MEGQNLTAGKQGGNHLETRILRCRADKGNGSRFNMWKKGILLGFVETVNLIDEEQSRFLVMHSPAACALEGLL